MNVDKIGSYDVAPVLESGQVVKPNGPILVPGLTEEDAVWGIYLQEVVDEDHPDHGRVHIVHQGDIKAKINGLMPAVPGQPVLVGTDGKMYGGAHVEIVTEVEEEDEPLIPLEPSIPVDPNTRPVVMIKAPAQVVQGSTIDVLVTIESQNGYNYSWIMDGAELISEKIDADTESHMAKVRVDTLTAAIGFKAVDKTHDLETTETLALNVIEAPVQHEDPKIHLHAPLTGVTGQTIEVVTHFTVPNEYTLTPTIAGGTYEEVEDTNPSEGEEDEDTITKTYTVTTATDGDIVFSLELVDAVSGKSAEATCTIKCATEIAEVAPVITFSEVADDIVQGDPVTLLVNVVSQNAATLTVNVEGAFKGEITPQANGDYQVALMCNTAGEVVVTAIAVDADNVDPNKTTTEVLRFNVAEPAPKDFDSLALNFASVRYVEFPEFRAENYTVEWDLLYTQQAAHNLLSFNEGGSGNRPFICFNANTRNIEFNFPGVITLEDAYSDNIPFTIKLVKEGANVTITSSNGARAEGTVTATTDMVLKNLGKGIMSMSAFARHFSNQCYKIKMTDDDTGTVREYDFTRGVDTEHEVSRSIPEVNGGQAATIGGDTGNLSSLFVANHSKTPVIVLNKLQRTAQREQIAQAVRSRMALKEEAGKTTTVKLTSSEGVVLKPAKNLKFITGGMNPLVRIEDDHDCC